MDTIRQAVRLGRLDDKLAADIAFQKYETILWDYKEFLSIDTAETKAELARDIAAFHNAEGGYIVIGIRNGTWELVGCDETALRKIDQVNINNAIRPYVGDRVSISYRICWVGGKALGLIYIPQRVGRPVLMLKNGPEIKKAPIFREGDLYVRTGDSTKRVTTDNQLEALWTANLGIPPAPPPSSWSIIEYGYRLPPRPEPLVGREEHRELCLKSLDPRTRWWITSIDGLGGVGKTALASSIVWEFYEQRRFGSIVSVTAKNRELGDNRIIPLKPELVGIDSIVDAILETNGFKDELAMPLNSRIEVAKGILEMEDTLIFLDNLETVEDLRVFEFLKNLPSPTRALVTSRRQPETGEDRIQLPGIKQEDSHKLIDTLLEEWKMNEPIDDISRKRIVNASGGLPLAIRWLVGQVRLQGTTSFLKTLDGNVPQVPDQILEFSFRNMFTQLGPDQRHLLRLSALSPDEPLSVEHYMHLTDWDRERTLKAITGLTQSSFFVTMPSDGAPAYGVLPITASFAHSELLKQSDVASKARAKLREMQYRQRDAQTVVDYLQSLVQGKSEAEQLAVGLAKAASEEYATGQYERGRQLFDQAESYYANSPYVFYTRATSEMNAGNSTQAHVYFDKAVRHISNPTERDAVVWKTWGQLYKQENNWRSAVDKLGVALNLRPDDPYAMHMMAFCQSKLRNYSAADRLYLKSLEVISDASPRQKKLVLTSMVQNRLVWGEHLDDALQLLGELEKRFGSDKRHQQLKQDVSRRLARGSTSKMGVSGGNSSGTSRRSPTGKPK